ncbi:hypothetical protein TgHK011_005712 [Trichoderma gracile]|nr:hypothetical protein TgHK011_005712 [Trichoderma gracile]
MGDDSAPSDAGTGTGEPIVPDGTTKGRALPQGQDQERMTPRLDNHRGPFNHPAASPYTSPPQPGPTASSTFFHRHGPYNMASLANALPMDNYPHGQYQRGVHQPRYAAGLSPPMAPHMPPIPQYAGHSPMPMLPQGYYVPQAQHISPYYGGGHLAVSQVNTAMLQRQNVAYYPSPVAMGHPPTQYYYPQTASYPVQMPSVPPVVTPGQQHPRAEIGQRVLTGPPTPNQSSDGLPLSYPSQKKATHVSLEEQKNSARHSSRKPRQTGNAVWIGNLPPQTDLMTLVRHVSTETTGLESLFLIAKSNCAFANFKDEASCIAAQVKLHESRFQSVRLVSRLRKNELDGSAGPSPPTGPALGPGHSARPTSQAASNSATKVDGVSSTATVDGVEHSTAPVSDAAAKHHDRFFILKSLTVDDLELSVRTGIWATQSHNEETLTDAFKQCTNVYLIFSANKSGEYFGYARMASEFSPSLDSTIKFAPVHRSTNEADLTKEILTDATEYVPKGRILHDPTRGTIFWEVFQDDSEHAHDHDVSVADGPDGALNGEEEEERSWGKPFRVEWLSTSRLPFHRIRGLRNPWNSNREVKIARDGTEIEPSVGQRLIGLFNTSQGSGSTAGGRSPAGAMPRYQQTGSYAHAQ